ncbi:MAG TPA: hypothetical protein VFE96_05040 [Candidatus Bathyarchaeia archaeon]|jgi:hypothetical protein|nr:hypothetical protein [Candidatus Bathyarchaeia archaeon]
MIDPKPGIKSQFILVSLIVLLSLWISIPFFLGRYFVPSGPLEGLTGFLELLALVLPVAGGVAALYGWYYQRPTWAFLIGVVPYAPLLVFGIPAALFFGGPMGLIGVGSTLIRKGKTDTGSVMAFIGGVSWLVVTALLFAGFR